MRRSCLFPGILLLALSGCAFGPQLRRVAVNHNDLVANSSNELVLLNILRARDREPLHFTSVSKLLGDANVQGTVGANVAIRGSTETVRTSAAGEVADASTVAGTEVTTPSAQLLVSGKSSMDVAVWDTQEFYQGITASVPSSTVAHYLHQGWPSDLLTFAFVSSVELVAREAKGRFKKDEVVATFINDPDDPPESGDFARFVSCFQLHTIQKSKEDAALVPLSEIKDLSLADLAVLDGDKFDVDAPPKGQEASKNRWIRRKGKTSDFIALRRVSNKGHCLLFTKTMPPTPAATGATSNVQYLMNVVERERTVREAAEGHSFVATAIYVENGFEIPVNVQIVLRSVEGIIYFLGEYIRVEEPPYVVRGDVQPVPILRVTRRKPARAFVSTRYKGDRYYVPATFEGRLDQNAGRSSQMFGFVQQLLNLHKSAKDRPTTQTVRVVQ